MLDTYRAGDLNDFGQIQVVGVDPDTAYLCHVVCGIGKQLLVEGLTEIRLIPYTYVHAGGAWPHRLTTTPYYSIVLTNVKPFIPPRPIS